MFPGERGEKSEVARSLKRQCSRLGGTMETGAWGLGQLEAGLSSPLQKRDCLPAPPMTSFLDGLSFKPRGTSPGVVGSNGFC